MQPNCYTQALLQNVSSWVVPASCMLCKRFQPVPTTLYCFSIAFDVRLVKHTHRHHNRVGVYEEMHCSADLSSIPRLILKWYTTIYNRRMRAFCDCLAKGFHVHHLLTPVQFPLPQKWVMGRRYLQFGTNTYQTPRSCPAAWSPPRFLRCNWCSQHVSLVYWPYIALVVV